jgi:hypothetical protein
LEYRELDANCQSQEKIEKAQFKRHSEIVIKFQVFAANIQTVITILKAYVADPVPDLGNSCSKHIIFSGQV